MQGDLIEALRQVSITLESTEWWFERFTPCLYHREMETEAAAKAERAGKPNR